MPRNANGSGSIRKKTVTKPDGRSYIFYEARVTVGFDENGRQKQKSISGKTQTEVRRKMSKMISEVDRGSYTDASKQTLSEWLDIWLETYIEGSVKPYTVDSYRGQCENHIKPALGSKKLSALTTTDIQKFYNSLGKTKKLSPKTIKNVHGVLHSALEKAVELRLISSNPSNMCSLPTVVKKDITPLEQEDISILLEDWRRHKYYRVYVVTLFTGMRQGEVLGLTWDCVDFDDRAIHVNKQLQKTSKVGGTYYLPVTKNSQTRTVYVAPFVMDIFREQKSIQNQMRRKAGDAWHNEWNLVFTNEFGGHLTHIAVYKRFKESVRRVGLDETRFHDLRHSFAVASLESGDDIKTVQENLGHSSAAFTMNVYAHASKRMKKRSAENMERYIQEVRQ